MNELINIDIDILKDQIRLLYKFQQNQNLLKEEKNLIEGLLNVLEDVLISFQEQGDCYLEPIERQQVTNGDIKL